MLPPVSVPSAPAVMPAATAAALPPLLPPGTRARIPGIVGHAAAPSFRSMTPSRTRPCWSCRAAPCPASSSRWMAVAREDRHVARQDVRAAGRLDALGGHHILDRQRDAEQRAVVARRACLIGGGGVLERPLRRHGDEGVERRLKLLDALQIRLRQFDGGNFARAQLAPAPR